MQYPVNKQFMIVVSNPLILRLRSLVIAEYFPDVAIERFIDRRVSKIMEEFFYLYMDLDNVDDDIYRLVLEDIFTFIDTVIPVMNVKSIECWDHDTIFIHCSPIGAKNVSTSKDQ